MAKRKQRHAGDELKKLHPPAASNDKHPEGDGWANVSPPQSATAPESRENAQYCKPDQTPLWKVVLDCAVVLIAICAAFIYKGQWDAAAENNRINAENFKVSQRPWIGIETPLIRVTPTRTSIELTAHNYGSSPSFHTSIGGSPVDPESTATTQHFLHMTPIEESCKINTMITKGTSGDGQEHGYTIFPGTISKQVSVSINPTLKVIGIIGCVTYVDQFYRDGDPIHTTRYCFNVPMPIVDGERLSPCFSDQEAN